MIYTWSFINLWFCNLCCILQHLSCSPPQNTVKLCSTGPIPCITWCWHRS